MMPMDAEILSVCLQEGIPVLFAKVRKNLDHEPRIIRNVTTGEEFQSAGQFIGTIQWGEPTWYVAHIFEQGDGPDPISERFADDHEQVTDEVVRRYIETGEL